jgi:BirA family transcriptional regulator, biotin operon repressor / biotin---[acetyl-CoA-carboxylase] ligase
MRNTLFVGKVYLRFDEIASTNDYAKEILSKSKPAEGMVIRADNQSDGHGQFGSKWDSSRGENLLLSLILYPNFLELTSHFLLSACVALAVRDCVAEILPTYQVKIKWPNDIYINNKKVAGILIQNSVIGNHLQSSIVGIGLNINQLNFPDNLPNAGSLASVSGFPLDIDTIETNLFQQLEFRYLQLKKTNEHPNLLKNYHEYLFRIFEVTEFLYEDGTSFWGIVQGVTLDGKMQVAVNGQALFFDVKDVKMKI